MCNQYHLVGGEVVLQTKAFKDMSEINYDQTKTCQVSPHIHLHFTCRIYIPVLYLTILFCMMLIVDNRGIIFSFMILLSTNSGRPKCVSRCVPIHISSSLIVGWVSLFTAIAFSNY